jgi:hypothetical protein
MLQASLAEDGALEGRNAYSSALKSQMEDAGVEPAILPPYLGLQVRHVPPWWSVSRDCEKVQSASNLGTLMRTWTEVGLHIRPNCNEAGAFSPFMDCNLFLCWTDRPYGGEGQRRRCPESYRHSVLSMFIAEPHYAILCYSSSGWESNPHLPAISKKARQESRMTGGLLALAGEYPQV